MTIQELIALLQQQGGTASSGAGGGTAASVPSAAVPRPTTAASSPTSGSALGSGISAGGAAALLPKILALANGQSSNMIDPNNPSHFISNPGPLQDAIGNSLLVGEGAAAGSQYGPWGALVGAGIGQATGAAGQFQSGDIGGGVGNLLLGPGLGTFVGDLIAPAGIPREAKSSALGAALEQTGNPLDELIGRFVNRGVGAGHVLSESGGSTFEGGTGRLAAMLEALTGMQAPSASATGFNNNPTYNSPLLGKAAKLFQLPTGDEFVNTQSGLAKAAQDIERMLGPGMSAPSVGGKSGQMDWQRLLSELSAQGVLKKYAGQLGAPGATSTSAGAIPNISLPHPLAQNQQPGVQPPYPV